MKERKGQRVDAHQHFWRYDPASYPWIQTPELRRDYLPKDLEPRLDAAEIDGTVAVQARTTWEENRWLLSLADAHPWIWGVVGWADLQVPDLSARLAHAVTHPKFCGVRGTIPTDPATPTAPRAGFLRGIHVLTASDLTFDLLIRPPQLPLARRLVESAPDQRFVLDHLAKPPIAEQRLEPWASQVRRLAERPNVACKLSGMVTEADVDRWQPSDVQPYLDVVLEAFGPERLLIGSDWPVCRRAASYETVLALVEDAIASLSKAEQAEILGGSAVRWYHLSDEN